MNFKNFLSLFVFLSTSLTPFARAVEIPNPSSDSGSWYYHYALTSTARSNIKESKPTDFTENDMTFTLSDGTRLSGLLFKKRNPNPVPLIILNFGALADRRSRSTRGFIENIFLAGKIDANLLIVDSVSSAGFYVLNGNLSLGGYDEGRVLVDLAKQLRSHPPMPFSSLHLVGVSLGGIAVIHALLEDQKQNAHLFQSAITFSAVVDQETDTRVVLNTFGYQMAGATSDQKLPFIGSKMLLSTIAHFNDILSGFGITGFSLPSDAPGQIIYELFESRLHWLYTRFIPCSDKSWNDNISRLNVESYIHDSSQLIDGVANLKTPLILVHAKDDPIIPYSEFRKFADTHLHNPNVQTLGVDYGGHWGFLAAYGSDWVNMLVRKMLTNR